MSAPMTAIATTRGQHFSPSKAALKIVAYGLSQMLSQAHFSRIAHRSGGSLRKHRRLELRDHPGARCNGKAIGSATLLAVARLGILGRWIQGAAVERFAIQVQDRREVGTRLGTLRAQFLTRALASPGCDADTRAS